MNIVILVILENYNEKNEKLYEKGLNIAPTQQILIISCFDQNLQKFLTSNEQNELKLFTKQKYYSCGNLQEMSNNMERISLLLLLLLLLLATLFSFGTTVRSEKKTISCCFIGKDILKEYLNSNSNKRISFLSPTVPGQNYRFLIEIRYPVVQNSEQQNRTGQRYCSIEDPVSGIIRYPGMISGIIEQY